MTRNCTWGLGIPRNYSSSPDYREQYSEEKNVLEGKLYGIKLH